MNLRISVSNRLEVLAEKLAGIVRIPLSSPFQPETVIVQSRGMERWISMALARYNGICANASFPFPNVFLQDILCRFFPGLSERTPFDRDVMSFRIMKRLPDCIHRPGFEDVKRYLQDDEHGVKRYQLSENIADTFDQYLVYRPEMIGAWESGKGAHWQARLWRDLVSDSDMAHRTRLRNDLMDALGRRADVCDLLPERISIFGISHLPRFHMEVFGALSHHIDVHLFLMNPCREYWADILSNRESRRIRNVYRQRGKTDTDLHLEPGNRLLAAMGTQARDFFHLIGAFGTDFDEAYIQPGESTLLARIQSEILNLKERSGMDETVSEPASNRSPTGDSSIRFHSCHSPMREIEVLHNQLLAMFEENPDLTPGDIIVMTPDIDRYAPYIQAVFSSPSKESMKIPFSIADRRIRRQRRMIEAFLCLLNMKGTRFEAAQICTLLEFSSIRKRFDLTEQHLETIERWIRETGIRWGIDAENRSRLGLPATPENTWRFGIDRLLLGFAMPGYGRRLYGEILPYDDVEGQEGRMLGRFLAFIDRLVDWIEVLDRKKTLSDWKTALWELMDTFLAVDEDTEKDFQMIRSHLNGMSEIQELSGFETPAAFDVIRTFLSNRLDAECVETGFISGGVTFCAMLPMRSIPFDVVCLIGMNNDRFPRESRVLGFDFIRRYPKPGDRSKRNDDRYLFLEAILSARKRLYVSYVGQSIQDNTRIPPSVPVSELMDHLSGGFDGAVADCVVLHPLQGFSPDYFTGDHPELFTYSPEDLSAAAGLLDPQPPCAFIGKGLSPPAPALRRLDIGQLARFWSNPARYLLRQRLGIYLEDGSAALSERENFHPDPLQRYSMGQDLVEGRRSGMSRNRMHRLFRAAGVLPHGNVGAAVYQDLTLDAEVFLNRIDRFDAGAPLEALNVALEIGPFHISGKLDRRYRNGLLYIRYATARAKDLLSAWMLHLLSSAAAAGGGRGLHKTILISRDSGWEFLPVADGENLLGRLLERYCQGMSTPLHFFPESALAYCRKQLQNSASPDDALAAAYRTWKPDPYGDGWGESDDPYYSLCFRHIDPLDSEFEDVSAAVFNPLLNHCRAIVI